jgi:hypothetical protein
MTSNAVQITGRITRTPMLPTKTMHRREETSIVHIVINTLHGHFNTALVTGSTLAKLGEEVGDVIPRMPVQTSAESLLIEEVGNETDRTTEHEETVQDTHLEVVLGFLVREGPGIAEEIDETDGHASIDVEDEVILLGRGDGFHGDGVIEQLGGREVLLAVFLDEGDAQIGIVS